MTKNINAVFEGRPWAAFPFPCIAAFATGRVHRQSGEMLGKTYRGWVRHTHIRLMSMLVEDNPEFEPSLSLGVAVRTQAMANVPRFKLNTGAMMPAVGMHTRRSSLM